MSEVLTVEVTLQFGQCEPGGGDPEPVVELQGAGGQFEGLVVVRKRRVGVGEHGRLSQRVGEHVRGVKSAARRMESHHGGRRVQEVRTRDASSPRGG